jgi:glycosyltransferase involved in cell wall biosynthesis
MLKVVVLGGFASSLINFRGPLLVELKKKYEVFGAAPFLDVQTVMQLESMEVIPLSTYFDRTGLNPIQDFKAYKKLKKDLAKIKPDVLLAYTIKPVVFGLLATQKLPAQSFALITGRGSGFEKGGLKRTLVSGIVKFLYRTALKSAEGVIFQNPDDLAFFREQNIINKYSNTAIIEGTGVDLNHYKAADLPKDQRVVFLFVARMIREKGIYELIEAARILKSEGHDFELQMLGWVDPNPGGISKSEIERLHDEGLVNYLGETNDVRPFIESASVFILPSYYNEGLPRTIQEAMAMKKPIITTDHPGCRATVNEGVNGFLVPIRDHFALANAMRYFLENPDQILLMGDQSFEMAKERFDVKKINQRILSFMGL